MKIKNSNFYLSFTLVLILSVCFAVTPSQAGSAVASGSAGTLSATGQVYLHLSGESMPYATGFGMVEIDVVGGDFQSVEGELWASYETSLTNNQISIVAAGASDQVKIVFATGQIGEDPSTSDTFETIYIPSDDTGSQQSDKGDDPHAEKRASRDMQAGSGDPSPGPISLTTNGEQNTMPEEEQNPSDKGNDPHAEKRAFRDMQAGSGDPSPGPISLTMNGEQNTMPEEEQNPSDKGDDPHAKKRALRDMQARAGDPSPGPISLTMNGEQNTMPEEEQNPSDKGDDPHAEKRALRDMQARAGDSNADSIGLNANRQQDTTPSGDEDPDDSQRDSDDQDDESEE